MKKAIMLLAAMVVALGLASGMALAATIVGTDGDETLVGTASADTIRAKGGNDVVWGLSGRDEIHGGYGADTLYGNRYGDKIYGGFGEGDRLHGGFGDDRLFSEDIFSQSGAYRDVVDCGPGHDFASVDFRDRVMDNCEEVGVAIP